MNYTEKNSPAAMEMSMYSNFIDTIPLDEDLLYIVDEQIPLKHKNPDTIPVDDNTPLTLPAAVKEEFWRTISELNAIHSRIDAQLALIEDIPSAILKSSQPSQISQSLKETPTETSSEKNTDLSDKMLIENKNIDNNQEFIAHSQTDNAHLPEKNIINGDGFSEVNGITQSKIEDKVADVILTEDKKDENKTTNIIQDSQSESNKESTQSDPLPQSLSIQTKTMELGANEQKTSITAQKKEMDGLDEKSNIIKSNDPVIADSLESQSEFQLKIQKEIKNEVKKETEKQSENQPSEKLAKETKDLKKTEKEPFASPSPKQEEKTTILAKEGESSKQQIKSPRFTIRLKLISIISTLLIVSLSLIIVLATFFFRRDSEIRIKENSLKLSQVLGLKSNTDLSALSKNARMLAISMSSSQQADTTIQNFLRNEEDILFLGIGQKKGNDIQFRQKVYNQPLLDTNQINRTDVDKINELKKTQFINAFQGIAVVENVSPYYKFPVMALSLPMDQNSQIMTDIMVIHVKLERILKAFERSDITESFMVNGQGHIMAHFDEKMVLANNNIMDLPIVQMMMKSKEDNGYREFTDNKQMDYLGSFQKLNFANLGVITMVEKDKALEEVYNIQRRNIIILVILLNMAILFVYFFAKTLSSPIRELVNASHQIEQGEFILSIKPKSKDEIGLLTQSFIDMGLGLAEREKLKDAFGKFVNKEIAERAAKGEIKLGGERKEAAIFFSDIRGFTAISEALSPEEVVEFLNEYMTAMVHCVNVTNGVVDKFIGDAIMAHWGAIMDNPNNTEQAVNAALMMRQALLEFNKDRGSKKKPIIKFGCGINSGPVIAGQIGSNDRLEYTVIGDAVNLASRVETLNKPFGTDILISQDSYNLVKDTYNVEVMPAIKVKGKSEPQTIYAVLGRKDDPNCPKSMDEVRKMVGIVFDSSKKIDVDHEEVKYQILDDKKKKES